MKSKPIPPVKGEAKPKAGTEPPPDAELHCQLSKIASHASDQSVKLLNLNLVKPVEILIGGDVVANANLGLPTPQESVQFFSSALLLAATDPDVVDDSTRRATSKKTDSDSNDGKSQRHINPWLFSLLCAISGALGGAFVSLIMIAMQPNEKS